MTRAWFVALAIGLLGPALLGPASTSARSSASSMTVKLSDRSIPASFAGQLTVDFHGDAASGCASRGLCGYSGTVSWRPSATGMLDVLSYREHGRLRYTLDLEAGNPNSVTGALGGVTTAKVQLSTPGSTLPRRAASTQRPQASRCRCRSGTTASSSRWPTRARRCSPRIAPVRSTATSFPRSPRRRSRSLPSSTAAGRSLWHLRAATHLTASRTRCNQG